MFISARIVAASMLAVGVFGTSGAARGGEDVTIEQVPPAVRQTIEREKGAGTIDEIERETENGVVLYEVKIKREGRKHEFKVREDGTLVPKDTMDRVEGAVKDAAAPLTTGITLDQVPAAVRKTVEAQLQGGKVDDIERKTRGNRVFYEVEIERPDGKEVEFNVTEDGTLLPNEGRTWRSTTHTATIGSNGITTAPAETSR